MKFLPTILAAVLAMSSAFGAGSRAELLFEINAALKTRDRGYFERCFAFADSDPEARGQVKAIVDEILRWPDRLVRASDRDPANAGAEASALNGEWTFQVHIQEANVPKQTFVFPAGKVGNEFKMLLVAKG